MIIADKILTLRKNASWSQEELAERLNVSRQSVSKWESGLSIPDIGKILEISRLFGVSTDYLVKDEIERPDSTGEEERPPVKRVGAQLAADYLDSRSGYGRRIALGVALCIFSPIPLILLGGISECAPGGLRLGEAAAAGIGLMALFVLVAAAVTLFILGSGREREWRFLDKEDFVLEYGVAGVVGQRRDAFEHKYIPRIALAVCLCIFSPAPLIAAGLRGASDFVCILLTALLMAVAGVACWIFITQGCRKEGFDRLLKDGDYEPSQRESNRRSERFGAFYWPAVTAVYLGWSLTTNRWEISWVVWPVAGLLFAGISAALKKDP